MSASVENKSLAPVEPVQPIIKKWTRDEKISLVYAIATAILSALSLTFAVLSGVGLCVYVGRIIAFSLLSAIFLTHTIETICAIRKSQLDRKKPAPTRVEMADVERRIEEKLADRDQRSRERRRTARRAAAVSRPLTSVSVPSQPSQSFETTACSRSSSREEGEQTAQALASPEKPVERVESDPEEKSPSENNDTVLSDLSGSFSESPELSPKSEKQGEVTPENKHSPEKNSPVLVPEKEAGPPPSAAEDGIVEKIRKRFI